MRNRRCKTILYLGGLLLVVVLFYVIVSCFRLSRGRHSSPNPQELNNVASLWTRIKGFEAYVALQEDVKYGYRYNVGYPMYLGSFGTMYLQLFLKTSEGYYKRKLERILEYIRVTKNENWTWNMNPLNVPVSLYNTQFAELFLDAYLVLKDDRYLEGAKLSIGGLKNFYDGSKLITKIDTKVYEAYNPNFFAFVSISYYCSIFSDSCSSELLDMARNLYAYSMRGYDKSSGRWRYESLRNTRLKKYLPNWMIFNGHDAFYELIMISSFLEHKSSIKAVFPDIYQDFFSKLPKMVSTVKLYILPDVGTFNYDENAPKCVECCADTALAFYLIDRELGLNNSLVISDALRTLLQNQDGCGAFYQTVGSKNIVLWYSDNIAEKLPKLLNLVANGSRD